MLLSRHNFVGNKMCEEEQIQLNQEIIKLRRRLQQKFADEKTSANLSLVYHYTSPEALLNIIENHNLWFSEITYMNDESEIRYTFELLKELVKNDKLELDLEFKEVINSYIQTRLIFPSTLWEYVNREASYVACFSTEKDELALWNYYTKTGNMAGYNIGFNVKKFVEDIRHRLKKMHYFIYGKTICNKSKQENFLQEAVSEFNLLYKKTKSYDDKNNLIGAFWGLIDLYSLFFKQPAFKNENEYRFVITELTDPLQRNSQAYQIKHRTQNGLIIPYINVDFSKECVQSIITAPTIRQAYHKAGIESLLLQNEYYRTKVETSNIPLRY